MQIFKLEAFAPRPADALHTHPQTELLTLINPVSAFRPFASQRVAGGGVFRPAKAKCFLIDRRPPQTEPSVRCQRRSLPPLRAERRAERPGAADFWPQHPHRRRCVSHAVLLRDPWLQPGIRRGETGFAHYSTTTPSELLEKMHACKSRVNKLVTDSLCYASQSVFNSNHATQLLHYTYIIHPLPLFTGKVKFDPRLMSNINQQLH